MESARATALDLISFIDAAPSPYHAAAEALGRLTAAGFTEVDQAAEWPAGPGRYVLTDGGSLFAWIVPEGCPPDAPFRLLGAHTDSPTLRLKPRPDTGRAASGSWASRSTAARCSIPGWTATSAWLAG